MGKFVVLEGEDCMHALCRIVVDTNYDTLPRDVVASAKSLLLDVMAITIGGSAMEGIPEVVDFVKEKGGTPESIIPFYGGKVPASEAGFAIGPMSRAMDCGPVHEESLHSTEYVFPPLLAATGLKREVTGKELITAFVLGQEVLIRIGMAYNLMSGGGFESGRYIGHSIFGCVAAVGKLLALSLDELENAQGIALEMTQPHIQLMYRSANHMVHIHHGFIAQDAINACLLAKRGITGPCYGVLDEPMGFLGFAKWKTKPEALTEGLGKEWRMTRQMMKLYTCCNISQSSIYGLLNQMGKYHFKADDISEINIQGQLSHVSEPKDEKWNPQTVKQCQFSLPYTVAVAAHQGDVFMHSFTPEARSNPEIRRLMTRITVEEDPSIPFWGARINTTLGNGSKYSEEYLYKKGHPLNPVTDEDIVSKFKKCIPYSAYELKDEAVDTIIESFLDLEKVDDVKTTLLPPLTPE